jgi:serine protease AprX
VSIKLADAAGRTDVSQVIAGIDWVVSHAHDPGLNIRVLNLSFGTDSMQDYRLDPLAHAAEVAWDSGIVVVVSAGNGNNPGGGLANPAYDPNLLAVGTVDTHGTTDTRDDTVAGFSKTGNSGSGKRGPDLLAPGVSLVSLRAPGSLVDLVHGTTGTVGRRFFKGSGTSQSAAVVSGATALLLSRRPDLEPDQVRDILRRSARDLRGPSSDAQGDGALDLNAAYAMASRTLVTHRVHAGGGSLDASRGHFKVKRNGRYLSGEQDIFGRRADTRAMADRESRLHDRNQRNNDDDDAWTGEGWVGGPLAPESGAYWNGATWAGAAWTGTTWAGATWADDEWDGATWAGATWNGATWAGATWAGATWAGATWADAQWADALWASASWE